MKTQQKILITGASSGFGFLTAKAIAEKGHIVFATMRDTEGRNRAKKEDIINWAKERLLDIRVVDLDVTSDLSVESAKKEILLQTDGAIDVIINNAGIYGGGIQETFTIEDYKMFFDVNVFGGVRVNNAFLPVLRAQGDGLIIQISSTLGRTIIPFGGVYGATKWAVEALSENLAYELKPLGIEVAIVQPGPFPTEIFQKSFTPGNISLSENYGKSTEIMIALFDGIKLMMSDENVPNKPQDVADAILNLINLPQGKRPLRTVVDKMMSGTAEIINDTSNKVQDGILQNFGLNELNIYN
ncbi:SDR family oxidoreductase [Flavobacterium sp.]|uniref:SDR family oxidoreductase n=1 Tax=Flavobacterium sp. TaxID=239 RepID=UPI0026077658|nr:SDR family oxidoreductase [Flavobacterium sp.]